MNQKIDLHAHTTHSDGKESVEEVFVRAQRANLTTLAITDHDTTSGWVEAAEQALATGIRFVPGIEITSFANVPNSAGSVSRIDIHMLAYMPDPNNIFLLEMLAKTIAGRVERLKLMTEMIGAKYPLTWDFVQSMVPAGATLGRPAIADALVALKEFTDRQQVFDEILSDKGPYIVPNPLAPEVLDAIHTIRKAGGVPIIAHPLARGGFSKSGNDFPLRHFEEMIEAGLAGFECYHRDVSEPVRQWLLGLAEKHDLIVTGSSDYHGETGKPNRLGENTTSPEMFERIVAQATGSKPIG